MDTSYLSLVSGSRISNYLGLKMTEGSEFSYPGIQNRQYAYIEIPVGSIIVSSTGEITDKALRNQHVLVQPACTVDVKGNYRFEVHPNPAIWAYGTAQGMYYLEPSSGQQVPGFYVTLRKDIDLSTLDYAVRIYMRT